MSAAEVDTMHSQIVALKAGGAQGIVLGVLLKGGRIHESALRDLVAATAPHPLTFHKAFDEVIDPDAALEVLIDAGVARLLTSGGEPSAWKGRRVLQRLVRSAGGRIEIIGAGGVRGDHAAALVAETGLAWLHARAEAIPGLAAALSTAAAGQGPPSEP